MPGSTPISAITLAGSGHNACHQSASGIVVAGKMPAIMRFSRTLRSGILWPHPAAALGSRDPAAARLRRRRFSIRNFRDFPCRLPDSSLAQLVANSSHGFDLALGVADQPHDNVIGACLCEAIEKFGCAGSRLTIASLPLAERRGGLSIIAL